jgi:hypothetical protein
MDNVNVTIFALFKGGSDFNAGAALAIVSSLHERQNVQIGNNKLNVPSQATGRIRGGSINHMANPISGGTAFDGNWHSVAFRRNGTRMDLFVDGSIVNSFTDTLDLGNGTSDRTCLMHPLNPGTPRASYAKGSVQHAAVWNTALSDSEMAAIQAGRNH